MHDVGRIVEDYMLAYNEARLGDLRALLADGYVHHNERLGHGHARPGRLATVAA